MNVTLIAAVSMNNVIGVNGAIPWRSRADQLLFKQKTWGHAVIMGRKTWESMNRRTLPGRLNLVISSTVRENCFYDNLPDALQYAKDRDHTDAFLIGGAGVYDEGLPYCDLVDITWVPQTVQWGEGAQPVFFPHMYSTEKHQMHIGTVSTPFTCGPRLPHPYDQTIEQQSFCAVKRPKKYLR